MDEKFQGSCIWFSDQRGYGFLRIDGDPKDIFVHYSNVNMEGYKTLKADQRVEFEIAPIEGKGRHAINVNIL